MTGGASRLYAILLYGRDLVCVLEDNRQADNQWRSFAIDVNGRRAAGEAREIPVGYAPRVAIHPPYIFFWGSATVWWSSLDDSRSGGARTFSEDVLALYRLRDCWVVVTELGVAVLDGAFERQVRHFSVDEVVVDHKWTGDVLSVEDLEGKIIDFDLSSI